MADGPTVEIISDQGSAGHRAGRESKGSRPARSNQSPSSLSGLVTKYVLLALVNALVVAGIPTMLGHPLGKSGNAHPREIGFAIAAIVALVAIDLIYLSRRMIAGKYLLPGTIFLLIFAVYPVIYTVYNSFTNYGTGNILSKSQAVQTIQSNSIGASDNAVRYDLQILAKGSTTGELAFLLQDTNGQYYLGTATGLTTLDASQVVDSGTRKTTDGYVALNLGEANKRKVEISAFSVPSDIGAIVNDGFGAAFVKEQLLRYDPATNTMVNTKTKVVYHEDKGTFVSDTGDQLDPGWRAFIGTANYRRINTPEIRGPFVRVFIWTFVFAVGSVFITFALGLLLALVFAHEKMRGRRFYRLAMVVPYALPSFMTALVWKGMLNQQFGVINKFFGINVPWLDGQWAPYASILLVNLWLGFPYMFLVCTGALQGIPTDLKEAAFVDGATGIRAFRRITLPLLLIAVAPLLIASFAFNFNNFNIIYLLTEGKPPIPGSTAGRTDILISYTYKLAFAGGRGSDYGFASAISVIIFILVAGISAFSFRYTRTFEEIK